MAGSFHVLIAYTLYVLVLVSCSDDVIHPDVYLRQGVPQTIHYPQSATSLSGKIFSPGYPNKFTTSSESVVRIGNLPNTRTWVSIDYLPASPAGLSCDGWPFTVGNSTVKRLISGPSCINLYKRKQGEEILVTQDVVIRLPALSNEQAFTITYNVSTRLVALAPWQQRVVKITDEIDAGYIMSHDDFNFGLVTLPKSTNFALTLDLPPATTSVKLRLIHFIIGHNRRALCESEESRYDNNNDHFMIRSGGAELYRCSGGVIWGKDEMLTFNDIRGGKLSFTLDTASNISYAGFFIRYDVTSCDDVANGVITRNGNSGSDFTVTCADGQTGSYQCHKGHWIPPRPVCNPVITNLVTTCERHGITHQLQASTDCRLYTQTGIYSLYQRIHRCPPSQQFDLSRCRCYPEQYVNCNSY